jgi:hypothetical protein
MSECSVRGKRSEGILCTEFGLWKRSPREVCIDYAGRKWKFDTKTVLKMSCFGIFDKRLRNFPKHYVLFGKNGVRVEMLPKT